MSTNPDLDRISDRIQRMLGERDRLASMHEQALKEEEQLSKDKESLIKALEILQVVAKVTQQELEIHISELTSLALEAIFPDPYKLKLSFELRRNRSEADLLLVDKEGNETRPMDSVGGGVVDIAALSLRISLWSLKQPRPANVIILDEPCRFVSRDLQAKAGEMIREISKKLGIQFIIVTHEENLTELADRVFLVSKKNKISKVEVLQ